MRFMGYEQSRQVPNIVVDGSPNESTVLALTHWPGIPQPSGLEADLSAEMAFRYLEHPPTHAAADVVTNNHFDQDGLVSVHALIDPERSMPHRELLIDVAAAGDFATYRFRDAARASMVIARMGESLDHGDPAAVEETYERALAELLPLVLDPSKSRDAWAEEDEALSASERAIADGVVAIVEHETVGVAVVQIPESLELAGGHRFGGAHFDGMHPMAINNATSCLRLLLVHGRRYRFTDRYETWVQTRSRPFPRRVDLAPLALTLTALEPAAAKWSAKGPGALTPTMEHSGESSLDPGTVVDAIVEHLASAPPAWDPFP